MIRAPRPEAPLLPDVPDDGLAALAKWVIEARLDLESMPGYPDWDGSGLRATASDVTRRYLPPPQALS